MFSSNRFAPSWTTPKSKQRATSSAATSASPSPQRRRTSYLVCFCVNPAVLWTAREYLAKRKASTQAISTVHLSTFMRMKKLNTVAPIQTRPESLYCKNACLVLFLCTIAIVRKYTIFSLMRRFIKAPTIHFRFSSLTLQYSTPFSQ